MKRKIKISRKNLASKNFDNISIVITGVHKEIPDNADCIATVIKNILLKEDILTCHKQQKNY